ncbi:hypothetical protein [Flavobacterium ginsengisoli]|uniref:hypothetical protein n=1 Tax=Flavobacterium ginsengisoli TaxID=871694 RepID=UPI0024151BD0|nr:hypothetical protein [Flavobacterium ginsengisoli]
MIQFTLKRKETGGQRTYDVSKCSYSIAAGNESPILHINVSMLHGMDIFLLEEIAQTINEQKSLPIDSFSDYRKAQEAHLEAEVIFLSSAGYPLRRLNFLNIRLESSFSESLSSYTGSEQINTALEFTSDKFEIERIKFYKQNP